MFKGTKLADMDLGALFARGLRSCYGKVWVRSSLAVCVENFHNNEARRNEVTKLGSE